MEVFAGPAVVISGPELEVLGRQLAEAIRSGYTARGRAAPRVLLDFAIAVSKAAPGTGGTDRAARGAGHGPGAERRNTREAAGAGVSCQPARTLSVKEAARAAKVSESYLRRLVRDGILEVRDGLGPYAIFADSLAAWQERRRRMEDDRKAA